tara:strand:- start:209 stop:490 length:282 start_codon:yes stop_codon:yes gene_type:complete
MTLVEKMVATAFYRGYSLSFDYVKYDEDTKEGSLKRRRLSTVSDIKYNDDSDILVCGYIDDYYTEFRKFFLDNMSDIEVFKKITTEEIDKSVF